MARFGALFQRFFDNKQLPSLRKLNDSVYEFYSPPNEESVSLEIIFFHGLERGDYSEAYVENWTSFLPDSTAICWPQTLLAEDFRRARILSVSYDSSIEKGPRQLHGNMDLYLIAENLVQDLIDDAKVATKPKIPVILVGKDLGGLVIKQVCMEAKDQNQFTFLGNLKGVFYYGTPHQGIQNLPTTFDGALAKRLACGNNENARLSSNFSSYRKNRWKTGGIMSLQRSEKVPELVIEEASQRLDVDDCITSRECIDRVCRNQARTSSSFKFLTSFISLIESGKLQFESCPDQVRTAEAVGFKTSLGFEYDRNYVPMETTLAEVKNDLQRKRIVVLHGGPGSGKSSLVRYLALQFEVAAQQQSTQVAANSSTEQNYWLPDGVVYITCGNSAEIIGMQQELLRKFNIEVPLLQDDSTPLDKSAEIQKMYRQALVDHFKKLQFRVVVIVDDIWDSNLLESLLVPGNQVKYLVTTQISDLWNAHDSKRVEMQKVTPEDAQHILGNYADFEHGVIPENFKNLADEIIEETEFHPLALATLGVVLDNMQKSSVEDWQELKDNLKKHLETKHYRPSSFGHRYPLSVDASMMLVLDLLDEDEKKLLYTITLFEGPLIRENLLRLFLMYTLPKDEKANFSKSKMGLVAKGLVRSETPVILVQSETPEGVAVMYTLSPSNSSDHGKFLWIHSLRQHFILSTKTEEISQITKFLQNNSVHKFLHLGKSSDLDFATALCALYGVADVKKRAVQKMGSHVIWSEEESPTLASALIPFVFLMLSEGDTKNHISQAASEVFLKYICEHELDDHNISYLLKSTAYPPAQVATLAALHDLFYIEKEQLINEGHLSFLSVILSLMDSRDDVHKTIQEKPASEATLIQQYACIALLSICKKAVEENSITVIVLTVPEVLTVLVSLIQDDFEEPTWVSDRLASNASEILKYLAMGDLDTRRKICNAEGVLAILVQSLSAHDNHHLQDNAVAILALLTSNEGKDDADIKLRICNAEGALAGLLQSLSVHSSHYLQHTAAVAISNISTGNMETKSKILNARGVLTALIESLVVQDNPRLQEYAATALGNLAASDVDTRLKICNAEGALAGLVQSLCADYNHPLQEGAAAALNNLTYGGDVQTKSKIINAKGALASLIQSLSVQENPRVQEYAAQTLVSLAASDVDTRLKICNAKGALAGLVQSLSADYNHPLQERAAAALHNLAYGGDVETKSKILNAKGAVASLIQSLSVQDNPRLQEYAAMTLGDLAAGDADTRLKLCNAEGALAGLVQSLSADYNHPLQEWAAAALNNLAYWSDVETKSKILNADGVLSGVIKSLSVHDNPRLQEFAAMTLAHLAAGDVDTCLKICNAEGALAGLVQSLSADYSHPLKEWSAAALNNLAYGGDVEIKSKILNTKGALTGFIESLSVQDNPLLQEYAATTLGNLAASDVDTGLKICNADGAFFGLVQSLSGDYNHPLQGRAAAALNNLASMGDVETNSKILNAKGALARLIQSLSVQDNPHLQENAAAVLIHLGAGNVHMS